MPRESGLAILHTVLNRWKPRIDTSPTQHPNARDAPGDRKVTLAGKARTRVSDEIIARKSVAVKDLQRKPIGKFDTITNDNGVLTVIFVLREGIENSGVSFSWASNAKASTWHMLCQRRNPGQTSCRAPRARQSRHMSECWVRSLIEPRDSKCCTSRERRQ